MMAKAGTNKLIMNIPVDLLEKVDEYAESMNVNRTSAVCVLLSQALESRKAMADLSALVAMAQSERK